MNTTNGNKPRNTNYRLNKNNKNVLFSDLYLFLIHILWIFKEFFIYERFYIINLFSCEDALILHNRGSFLILLCSPKYNLELECTILLLIRLFHRYQ